MYIGGYEDGYVRIWDATFPILSLVSVLGFEVSALLQAVNQLLKFNIYTYFQLTRTSRALR